MKKVININYHSRVIPIEESAYEILRQYSDSLKKYFANEEGRDEIINDIESRIAELFSERLKKGASCITDEDVTAIIASMGKPEDFEAADGDSSKSGGSTAGAAASEPQPEYQRAQSYGSAVPRGRLYRNADDKILGGVCSGLANYLGIDPVILRIAFVLLFGALIWVYLLLWIIVPSQSLQSNVTKRLFRSADDRVIGGVAGGLAAYFNIQTWIPRLIFALPFVLGLASGVFHSLFWSWDFGFGPRFVSGGLGGSLILTYIILWIAVPVATTASEKLEMRGERVDLNSIANTIKEDLEGFKGRAEKVGTDLKEGAQRFGSEFKNTAEEKRKAFSAEMSSKRATSNSGFGHVIGILFKAFFLFIAGIIALALFGVLIGLLFGGMAAFPLKNYLLSGYSQELLAWASLVLFLGVPIVALITWLIRRIMGARSRNHYLGYVFASLWLIGLICSVALFASLIRNFRAKDYVEDEVTISQPAKGKLYVDLMNGRKAGHYYSHDWRGFNWDGDWPLFGDNYDSLYLNTVRVNVVRSKDSSFHIQRLRFSHAPSQGQARELARKIRFNISQQDSLLLLARGFSISRYDKFRNQQALIVIEVPVGKKIELDKSLGDYNWFTINAHRNGMTIRDYDESYDDYDNWGDTYHWRSNVEYIMTRTGLERTDKRDNDYDGENNMEEEKPTPAAPRNDGGYRYRGGLTDSARDKSRDSLHPRKGNKENKKPAESKKTDSTGEKRLARADNAAQITSPVYLLATLFQ